MHTKILPSGRKRHSSNRKRIPLLPLLLCIVSTAALLIPLAAENLFAAATQRVSLTYRGEEPANFSMNPKVSADGRYIAFTSAAPDLVTDVVPSGVKQIYLYDRQLGADHPRECLGG